MAAVDRRRASKKAGTEGDRIAVDRAALRQHPARCRPRDANATEDSHCELVRMVHELQFWRCCLVSPMISSTRVTGALKKRRAVMGARLRKKEDETSIDKRFAPVAFLQPRSLD